MEISMEKKQVNQKQVKELLLQSLAHERGGVQIYETALKCVMNDELLEEWERYLEETRNHVTILSETCQSMGFDPEEESPGSGVVEHIGMALVQAMEKASAAGLPEAAELVACECVVFAETKDHLDWELIGKCAEKLKGDEGKALTDAYEQ